jgi:DNA-binding transcriptional MerR regulator
LSVDKAPDAFRTISEVAEGLDVPQHVLRFWESRFREIKPMKRGGGRRYYRPDDVDLLRGVRHLLYGEGYTIRGVQRILKEHGVKFVQAVWQPGAVQPAHGAAEEADLADEDTEARGAEELTETDRHRGLLGLLPSLLGPGEEESGEHPPLAEVRPKVSRKDPLPPSAPAVSLPREDLRKLQLALEELGECRRLIAVVLNEAPLPG